MRILSIVVWHSNVILDEYSNPVVLVVDLLNLLHLFIKDKCMLVSEDHKTCTILSSWDEEGVSEHLTEVSFTI